jgi:hypothetical protein
MPHHVIGFRDDYAYSNIEAVSVKVSSNPESDDKMEGERINGEINPDAVLDGDNEREPEHAKGDISHKVEWDDMMGSDGVQGKIDADAELVSGILDDCDSNFELGSHDSRDIERASGEKNVVERRHR